MNPEQEQSLVIENIAALPQFYELVELASEVCLSNPERVKQIVEHDKELIPGDPHLPNVWSARSLFESRYSNSRNFSKSGLHIGSAQAITAPTQFGPGPMPEIQLVVKAFGEALLEEAFVCLGKDAEVMVEAWQRDSSPENRIRVTNWLLERIDKIVNPQPEENEITIEDLPPTDAVVQTAPIEKDEAQTYLDELKKSEDKVEVTNETANVLLGDEDYFYHPARLSPKLLGVYPDTTFRPTCLAISVLATSFYKKAGEPVLHAGVMRTAPLETKRYLVNSTGYITDFAKTRGIKIPDDIAQKIQQNYSTYCEERDINRGYHAAAMARFDDKRWIIADPNYKTTCMIWVDGEKEDPNSMFEDISLVTSGLGGVEIPYERQEATMGILFEMAFSTVISKIPSADYITGMVDSLLTHSEPMAAIKDYLHRCLGIGPNGQGALQGSIRYHVDRLNFKLDDEEFDGFTAEDMDAYIDLITEDRINIAIDAAISEYLFPDNKAGQFDNSIKRLREDPHYRQNRIDDLQMLPLMVLLMLFSEITDEISDSKALYPHAYMEVGLAEHRIGMCVLNDFASYCGDGLPASFWTSHWASDIAWSEHDNEKKTKRAQHQASYQIAKLLDTRWLTYAHNGEIIRQFLEQGAQPKGVG